MARAPAAALAAACASSGAESWRTPGHRPATAAPWRRPWWPGGGRRQALSALPCPATPGPCIAMRRTGRRHEAAMRHEAAGRAGAAWAGVGMLAGRHHAAIGAAPGRARATAACSCLLPAAGGAGHQQGYTTIRDYCDRDCNCRDTARLECWWLRLAAPPRAPSAPSQSQSLRLQRPDGIKADCRATSH